MVRIEFVNITEEIVRYRYYPEKSKEYGIVALNRKTGERIFEKILSEYGKQYAAHAVRRIEEYQKQGTFPEKDLIAWH